MSVKCFCVREDGQLWDIIDWEYGVVSRVVSSRRLCVVSLANEYDLTIFYQDHKVARALSTGDIIRLKMIDRQANQLLVFEAVNDTIEIPFVKKFKGEVDAMPPNNRVAVGDVTIPSQLAVACRLRKDDKVQGIALLCKNRWKALRIKKI
jgi:hypothetical protein